jgi:hypothetical protein
MTLIPHPQGEHDPEVEARPPQPGDHARHASEAGKALAPLRGALMKPAEQAIALKNRLLLDIAPLEDRARNVYENTLQELKADHAIKRWDVVDSIPEIKKWRENLRAQGKQVPKPPGYIDPESFDPASAKKVREVNEKLAALTEEYRENEERALEASEARLEKEIVALVPSDRIQVKGALAAAKEELKAASLRRLRQLQALISALNERLIDLTHAHWESLRNSQPPIKVVCRTCGFAVGDYQDSRIEWEDYHNERCERGFSPYKGHAWGTQCTICNRFFREQVAAEHFPPAKLKVCSWPCLVLYGSGDIWEFLDLPMPDPDELTPDANWWNNVQYVEHPPMSPGAARSFMSRLYQKERTDHPPRGVQVGTPRNPAPAALGQLPATGDTRLDEEVDAAVLRVLAQQRGFVARKALLEILDHRDSRVIGSLDRLFTRGAIHRRGQGVRGNGFEYALPDVADEE